MKPTLIEKLVIFTIMFGIGAGITISVLLVRGCVQAKKHGLKSILHEAWEGTSSTAH